MTVYQLPAEVGAFAHHLGAVAARLVPGEGWYGVFASRDPDGLRACFEGTEIPPWDVVESLLQDLGEPPGGPEAARARALHGAAAAAHDRRPGGADALRARLAAAERERHHASARAEELGARLRVTAGTPDAGRTADELAWTADDHARATSRIAELTTRLTALARDGGVARGPAPAPLGRDGGLLRTPTPNPVPTPLVRGEGPARTPAPNPVPAPLVWGEGPARTPAPNPVPAPLVWGEGPARTPAPNPVPAPLVWGEGPARTPAPNPEPTPLVWGEGPPRTPAPNPAPTPAAPARDGGPARAPAPAPAPLGQDGGAARTPVPTSTPTPARRKPRGARYAGLDVVEEVQEVVPSVGVELPVAGVAPRGARFGGVEVPPVPTGRTPSREAEADAVRAAGNAAYALRRLRAQGRSGEAHALLCEAVAGPPARLPALAAELHRVGLGAEWATLLWEAASLPPGRLAAVAGALADAGRSGDCEQLLRQGVARPVGELAGACAALHAEGHHREAHALLTAFLRVRTPEDAAQLAAADPHGLVPQLREAARAVSPDRERDLLHALRVAGLAGFMGGGA